MPRKTYPLAPLVRVRKEHVDSAVKELSTAIGARERAEAARASAETERARHAERARLEREAEAARLLRGELTAVDLQRQGAWEARVAWEAAERTRQVAAAVDVEKGAVRGEGSARSGVASAEAHAKVVTSHQERWTGEQERRAEAAAEEDAAEAWVPRR